MMYFLYKYYLLVIHITTIFKYIFIYVKNFFLTIYLCHVMPLAISSQSDDGLNYAARFAHLYLY